MKKFKLLLTGIAIMAVAGCASSNASVDRSEILREKILSGDTTSVLVVAHRGDWRYAPENSIAAIEHSIAIGVDVVEVDLQMTADSVLILMHDNTLDRTTTGRGKVSDWTMDAIRTLNLKNGADIYTKHKVPTLEEALNVAKGKILVNLDKADRYFDQVMPVLERTGTTGQIIMKGGAPASVVNDLYGKYLDEILYMPIVGLDNPDSQKAIEDYVEILAPPAFELIYAKEEDVEMPLKMRKYLKGKALLWYNTLWDTMSGGHDDDLSLEDPDAGYGYLIDTLGARIIQTDRAEYLLSYLRERGLHE